MTAHGRLRLRGFGPPGMPLTPFTPQGGDMVVPIALLTVWGSMEMHVLVEVRASPLLPCPRPLNDAQSLPQPPSPTSPIGRRGLS